MLDVWLQSGTLGCVSATKVKELSGIELLRRTLRCRIDRLDLSEDVIDGALGLLFLCRHS